MDRASSRLPSLYWKYVSDVHYADETESWGEIFESFFELDGEGWPIRHLDVYANGNRCSYDWNRLHDQWGMLPDKPWSDADVEPDPRFDYKLTAISRDEFEQAWRTGIHLNRDLPE